MQEIDETVIDWWRILLEDQSADKEWMERHEARDRHRVKVRREILDPQAGRPRKRAGPCSTGFVQAPLRRMS